jgi:hypothetical protein
MKRKVTFGAFSSLLFIQEERFCYSKVTARSGDIFSYFIRKI